MLGLILMLVLWLPMAACCSYGKSTIDSRISRIDACIPNPRNAVRTSHPQSEILTSRIFGIAAGYEDGKNHPQLWYDAIFQVAAGRTPSQNRYDNDEHYPLASSSTHSASRGE